MENAWRWMAHSKALSLRALKYFLIFFNAEAQDLGCLSLMNP
jgi:hypothetical protein